MKGKKTIHRTVSRLKKNSIWDLFLQSFLFLEKQKNPKSTFIEIAISKKKKQ
ncbi:hypothetical protein A0G_1566 [Streptococcus iniae 9117]|nr:hypothetical protein A0G_1566 [Streptococcus iniae 9117]